MVRQANSYLTGAVSGAGLIMVAVVAFIVLVSVQALNDWPISQPGERADTLPPLLAPRVGSHIGVARAHPAAPGTPARSAISRGAPAQAGGSAAATGSDRPTAGRRNAQSFGSGGGAGSAPGTGVGGPRAVGGHTAPVSNSPAGSGATPTPAGSAPAPTTTPPPAADQGTTRGLQGSSGGGVTNGGAPPIQSEAPATCDATTVGTPVGALAYVVFGEDSTAEVIFFSTDGLQQLELDSAAVESCEAALAQAGYTVVEAGPGAASPTDPADGDDGADVSPPPADTGAPPADTGTPTPGETGTPSDTGTPPSDTGAPAADAGE